MAMIRRRLVGLAIVAVVLVPVAGLYVVPPLLLTWLATGGPVPASFGDVIVVPGGGMRTPTQLGISTTERIGLAAELYRDRPRSIIASDGVCAGTITGASVMGAALSTMGVRSEDILLEDGSKNTFENLRNSLVLARSRGLKTVVAVTSPYHQRRVSSLLDALGETSYRVAVMPASEVYRPGTSRFRIARLVYRECAALAELWLFGPPGGLSRK